MKEPMRNKMIWIGCVLMGLCALNTHAVTLAQYDDVIHNNGLEAVVCEAKDACFYAAPGASVTASCSYADPCDLQTAQGLLSGGDVLYLLAGTYTDSYTFTEGAYGDYEMIFAFGRSFSFQNPVPDSLNRVRIEAYPGDVVVFDGQYDMDNDTGAMCFYTDQGYLSIRGMTFRDCKTGINIGENRITDDVVAVLAENNHFTGTHFVNDNGGNIIVQRFALDAVVQNNRLDGPGANVGSMNSAGIYYTHDRHVRLLHNEISNHRTGIHYKHDHFPSIGDTGSVIAYNYITNTSIAARLNTRYTLIHDNISSATAGSFSLNHCSGVTGEGGDYNTLLNNYFYDLGFNGCSDGTIDQGAYQNTVHNNIILTRFFLHPWDDTPHDSVMNHNLYAADIFEDNVAYTLPAWQTHHGQDAQSLSGSPEHVNPALIQISDYQLTHSSPGYLAGNDGTDMGPEVSLVGVRD